MATYWPPGLYICDDAPQFKVIVGLDGRVLATSANIFKLCHEFAYFAYSYKKIADL